MKILAIRIKNLASLEGTTEIDFTTEPLCSAGIFAITGATGAGKSTILDAICLALYAKTPRYNVAKEIGIKVLDINGNELRQGDIGGILRNGTAEGFASIDFLGVDGHQHQATWRIRRARNKINGEIQADTIELKNLTTNAIFPGKKTETLKEIERLIGLSFDQFTRSVLLAQGDFTAFLKAKEDEKSSLLEKLTGTTIYSEISKLIYEKNKAASALLIDLKKDVDRTNSLTDEELAQIDIQIEEYAKTIIQEQTVLESIAKEINWHEVAAALLSKKTEAETALHAATTRLEATKARTELIYQIDAVQQIKSEVSAKVENTKSIENQTNALKLLITHLETLGAQKDKTTNDLTIIEQALEKLKKAQEDALPLLDMAKTLDTKLEEKELQKIASKNVLDKAIVQTLEQAKILANNKLEAQDVESSIEKINTWVNQNSARKPLAENIVLIESKLSTGSKILFETQQLESELKLENVKLEQENLVKYQLDKELGESSNLLQSAQLAFKECQNKLKNIDLENITVQKSESDRKFEKIKDAIVSWKHLFTNKLLLNDLLEKDSTNRTILQDNKTQLTTENGLLQEFTIKKQTAENVLNKARLAASENVEKLRAHLVPSEPCPVCGSVAHPYTTHNPQLDAVLTSLAEEHQAIINNYEAYLKSTSTISEKCASLEIAIAAIAKEIKVKQHEVNEAAAEWQSNVLYQDCEFIEDDKKESWLNANLQTCKENQELLHHQIIKYNEDKKSVDKAKAESEQLEKLVGEQINLQKDNQRNIQSLNEKIKNVSTYISANTTALEEIEQTLNPYFPNAQWKENWRNNQTTFTKKLIDFATEWKSNIQNLESNNQKYGLLCANIKGVEDKLNLLQTDEAQKNAILTNLAAEIELLSADRKLLFDGVAVKTVENKFKKEIEDGEEKFRKTRKLNLEYAEELTKSSTQKEMLINTIASLQASVEQSSSTIRHWLENYYKTTATKLTEENVIELLNYSYEWVAKERNAIKTIDDELNNSTTILGERNKNYNQHLLSQFSSNTLEQLLENLQIHKLSLNKISEEKTKLDLQRAQDAENKLEIAELLKSITASQAVAENWSKLNDLIGAADGKKFRQIAQEYTLDLLLNYANYQLKILSNRYLLERVSGTLGLQILDLDMGNEVRSVYSLSGGESFLVSLALALGLSSLSSNQMRVESLFIDEGFGSLDPQTLSIAMDALERLQNQGRKVGVISHVQEMTERITTQIIVLKMANGKSKVEVVS